MARRPFVEAMANAMQERLEANAHKNGMEWGSRKVIIAKLLEEVCELVEESASSKDPEKLRKEAADVANVAGMLAAYCDNHALPDWRDPPQTQLGKTIDALLQEKRAKAAIHLPCAECGRRMSPDPAVFDEDGRKLCSQCAKPKNELVAAVEEGLRDLRGPMVNSVHDALLSVEGVERVEIFRAIHVITTVSSTGKREFVYAKERELLRAFPDAGLDFRIECIT